MYNYMKQTSSGQRIARNEWVSGKVTEGHLKGRRISGWLLPAGAGGDSGGDEIEVRSGNYYPATDLRRAIPPAGVVCIHLVVT